MFGVSFAARECWGGGCQLGGIDASCGGGRGGGSLVSCGLATLWARDDCLTSIVHLDVQMTSLPGASFAMRVRNAEALSIIG